MVSRTRHLKASAHPTTSNHNSRSTIATRSHPYRHPPTTRATGEPPRIPLQRHTPTSTLSLSADIPDEGIPPTAHPRETIHSAPRPTLTPLHTHSERHPSASTLNQPSNHFRGTDHTPHIPPTHGVHPPQCLHTLPYQPREPSGTDAASSKKDESSTPYPIHLKRNDSCPSPPHRTPRTTRVPRNAPPPRAMSVPPLGGPGQPPPHPVDASHPLQEKNTSAHSAQTTSQHIEEHPCTRRGVSLPEPEPCQHHIPMTHHNRPHSHPPENITPIHPERGHPFGPTYSHLHADTRPPFAPLPRGCTGARDMRARQTRTHHIHANSGEHRSHPYPPQEPTVPRAPITPCTTTEHVLENPRGAQGSHPLAPPITPASPSTRERHTTNPTRTLHHLCLPKRSHHHTPWVSKPLPVGNLTTASPPPLTL